MAEVPTANKTVQLPSRMSVKSLAERLSLPLTTVMTELVKNGVMAAINEEIDYDTAAVIADDLGLSARPELSPDERADRQSLSEITKEDTTAMLVDRAPVVVVMGHVDHGKTKLLDAIRKSNVTEQEAGGITQHIGAYQVTISPPEKLSSRENRGIFHSAQEDHASGRMITFIDTPGHEAFSAMRSRGARVADAAILVVAADDGVKPQTVEAIRIITEAKLPFIVAINKVDKPDASPDRVKQELASKNVLVEDWGGTIVAVEVSAKNATGITELLDSLLLVVQVEKENLKANPNRPAVGTIIESHVDAGEGPIATYLVHTGTLRVGDVVSTGEVWGKIKTLKNFRGETISEAGPSVPVRILGLKGSPIVGDVLKVETDPKVLRELKSKKVIRRQRSAAVTVEVGETESDRTQLKKLNLVLRADTLGSLEAIKEALKKLDHPEVSTEIVQSGLGKITEADVLRAETAGALLLGFNVVATPAAESVARGKNIDIVSYDVIYDLVDNVRAKLEKLLEPEVIETELGRVKVLAVFRTESRSQIFGGRVTTGKVAAQSLLRILRNEQVVAEGKLAQLQSQKRNVSEVVAGAECGMKFEGQPVVAVGDSVVSFTREVRPRHIGG